MHQNVIEHTKSALWQFLRNTFQLDAQDLAACSITINTEGDTREFGDINSNAPLVLARKLSRKPIDIAQEIADTFEHVHVAHVGAAQPGFINITLNDSACDQLAQEIYTSDEQFFVTKPRVRTRYNIEYVSANPTGPLHFGHGRGGIIGDVLARIMQFNHEHATREYYLNDAGQQMHKLGMSLYYRCRQVIGDNIELPEDAYHGAYLSDIAHDLITEFGNDVVNNTYQFFARHASAVLRERIQNALARYRVTYDVWFSEKTLHEEQAVQEAIDVLYDRGYTYEQDGALWFTSTSFGDDKDRVLRRQSGDYTYVAADIAYLRNKFSRGFDQLVMVLGQDHHSYVDRLKGAAQALGYNPDRLRIILYQMVSLTSAGEQVRMSKRTGNIVSLDDIIDMVGVDAARYMYLSKKADAHLEFDIERARKQSDENPVFYIQYAYVRTKSILDKADQHVSLRDVGDQDLVDIGDAERCIMRRIAALKPLLHNIQSNYQTHLLAHYVYDMAHAFHKYYSAHKAILPEDVATSRMRIAMIYNIRTVLATGLKLLGLSQPEHM